MLKLKVHIIKWCALKESSTSVALSDTSQIWTSISYCLQQRMVQPISEISAEVNNAFSIIIRALNVMAFKTYKLCPITESY